MSTLDAATLPLHGRHLIEASAGTGKTFTVANLYLRLLIDTQGTPPPAVENILVVTFTHAATEELRARLRERIAAALQVLDGVTRADVDATLHGVLDPHSDSPATRARLELAYQSMDQAAIFTIHGFCERVLREQAFESGELFDAELQADVDPLRERAAQAWWRDSVTPLPADETESIPAHWRSPVGILKRLSSVIGDPDAQLDPQIDDRDIEHAQIQYQSAWQAFRDAWQTHGEDWSAQILAGVQSKLINKGSGKYTPDTVTENFEQLTVLAQQGNAPVHLAPGVAILGNNALQVSTRKGKEPLHSALGERLDDLVSAYSTASLSRLVRLQGHARTAISDDLALRKRLARQRTFDDLLLQLHGVLHGGSGERLTRVLQARYPVALIDEFQDTDRIQFEIFDKLFPLTRESTTALYLIGDPKQSIYRFRGADINMYLRARDSASARHSLDRNWRSSERLINALNALYAQAARPFGDADIHYQPVSAGGGAEGGALTHSDTTLAPLQFDYIDVVDAKLPNIDVSVRELAQSCARRVAWLLNGATLGDTPVQAKDIAVLVWTHVHGEAIRAALLQVGVASAMQSRESVFKSPEALDLLALLRAMAQPGDSASLSRVLISPLAGFSAQQLLQQRDDAAAWQHIEQALQRCREQCRKAGPQAAVLLFMSLFKSRIQAVGTQAANRRGIDRILGNYLHLADALQSAWQEQPDLQALLKSAQRLRVNSTDQALQLRLESDEDLVQIVTVHKSKGLQYPIVMLPFACMGKDSSVKGDSVAFTENGLPRLDVGSAQLADRQAALAQALQDESLRTLYVALTRAEQTCWIGVAANKNARYAALWQLMNITFASGNATADCEQPVLQALQSLVANCPDIATSDALPPQPALAQTPQVDNTLRARTAARAISASWRVGSYTALARGATHADESPDHDAQDVAPVRPESIDYTSPFHFPRGADAGTLIHSVFEHLDFRLTDDRELDAYAETQLRNHGVDTAWAPALCQLVRNTLDTPLNPDGFALGALDKKDRLDELGFHFPVVSLRAPQLVAALQEAGVLSEHDGLQFDRLDGYMTGFIDLIFRRDNRWYIADYKSNHLGYDSRDYHQDALTEAMQHHRYDLQYLIYAVALQRYLTSRLPDYDYNSDFGGIYYLFVRGMPGATDTASPPGVHFARPPHDLLQTLDQLLGGADHA